MRCDIISEVFTATDVDKVISTDPDDGERDGP
jgi:hypothetical protein